MKIYLGLHKTYGETYLEKHKWDCGWYWAFGYVGNVSCHWHIESLINHPKEYEPNWTEVSFHFHETWISQHQWWILRDLFISAYALKKAAEVYQYGGHQTASATPYRVNNEEMAAKLNADLKTVLDNIWTLLHEWKKESRK